MAAPSKIQKNGSALDPTEESNRRSFHWILKSNKGIDVIIFGSILENRTIAKILKINVQNISRIFGDMDN